MNEPRRNPIDSDRGYALAYGAAEASQNRPRCENHHLPVLGDGKCLIDLASPLFETTSKQGKKCWRDDWWEFREWLEDETAGWDPGAMATLAESVRSNPGDLLLRWQFETGPPALQQAIGEIKGAIAELLDMDVQPVRPLSHPRDYVREALAIATGNSNLRPNREHLKAMHGLWLQATQAVCDLVRSR